MSGWKVGRGTIRFRGTTYHPGDVIPDKEFVAAFPDEAHRESRLGTMRRMYGLDEVKTSQRRRNVRAEVQETDPDAGST